MSHSTKILILGGGFGGINVLKSIQEKFKNYPNVHISLVNKDNYFLYTPMLPQVTSGLIHPNDITIPIRKLSKNSEFYQNREEMPKIEGKIV